MGLGRAWVALLSLSIAASFTGASGADFFGFCGGLPPPSPYVSYFSQAFIATDLPKECNQWDGKKACCTPQTTRQALATLTDEYFETLSLTTNDSSEERHCFYGYYDYDCRKHYQWLQCAIQCDVLMPRDVDTGLPKNDDRLCYERFTARNGIDAVWHGRQSTACERALQIQDLGECGAVVVVGQDDIAIAAGNGNAICKSISAAIARATLLTVLTILFAFN